MDITRRTLLMGTVAAGLSIPPLVRSRQALAAVANTPALFVAAHPDDEILAMGVALAEHIAAGQDIHLLWLTRGEASGARGRINGEISGGWWKVAHNPAAEGYEPLTPSQFGAARLAEAVNAVRSLGAVKIHEAGLPDGGVTQASAEQAIRAVAAQINPGGAVRLKTHTHTVDNHADHLAVGRAVLSLGNSDPAKFGDRRYYLLPWYWSDTRLSKVTESWDNPGSTTISNRVINACRAYGAWSPPNTYAIGQHSVPDLFATIMARPRCMFHA
jgi:LmbE family N-acetylglucosaminyl deacetylase